MTTDRGTPEPHRPRDLFDGTLVTSGPTGEFTAAPPSPSPSPQEAEWCSYCGNGRGIHWPECQRVAAPSPDGERERMLDVLTGRFWKTDAHQRLFWGEVADLLIAAGFGDVTALRDFWHREYNARLADNRASEQRYEAALAEARQEAERAQDKWQQAEADAATFQDQRDRAREMASREQIERARLGGVVSTLREEMYLSRAEYDLLPPHTQYLLDRQLNRVRSLTATND